MTGTLTENIPLSVNIAAYIGLFSGMDMMLQGVFEKAIGGDGTWSDCILHHVQSISTRIDIVEDFLKDCRAGTDLAISVLPLIPRFREANTYRNKLAHGVYADGPERSVVVMSNMFARKKNFKMEDITAKIVLDEYNKLQQLYLDLLHALDAAPAGFPKKFDFDNPAKQS